MLYRYDSSCSFNAKLYPDFPPPEYDSVVDYSSYRPDSENARHYMLSGSGQICNPLYDESPEDVTLTELHLRSGKFDKAEISQIILSKKQDINKSTDEIKKEVETERLNKLQKDRQEYLDRATGFKGQPLDS